MDLRYSRNRIYIDEATQNQIKNFSVLIAGCGIGSVIAECALRLGFEKLTIVDGDQIELSNLNRQNYTEKDLNVSKAKTLFERLKSINNNAQIEYIDKFINYENISEIINHDVAINALDFKDETPLLFDEICSQKNIPVLHPYNLGWVGLVAVLDGSSKLSNIGNSNSVDEVTIVQQIIEQEKLKGHPMIWLEDIISSYQHEEENLPPPQLAIGTWHVAAMCTRLLYKIATGDTVKTFPEYYLQGIV
ncbi:ThiF family adenylyltransferase [Chryseobacterium sp. MFBS3-17]|nr:ThiF family adenylyltransferase [Chryseobacterium sp. MFBS3-17]